MDRSSRRYADEVSSRVDRVIRSIRSTSPISRSPVYIYETPVSAVYELNRMDNVCRSLAVENDILRDQVVGQTGLILENDRVHRDLSKATYENEVLKIENRKVPEYETKLKSMLRQSQELNHELNVTTFEADTWKHRFDEADLSAARYRSLYQNVLVENERSKNELLDNRKELAEYGVLKLEYNRLSNQNADLADAKVKVTHELLSCNQENINLREKLKQIDVLKAQLNGAEKDNSHLRDVIGNQNDIQADLKARLNQSQDECASLKAENCVIPGLKRQIENGVDEATKLSNMIVEQERTIKELRTQIAVLSGFEQKCANLQNDKQRLHEDQLKLNDTIVQKLEQIRVLQLRANEADVLESQVRYLEEDKLKLTHSLVDKSKECESYRAKASVVPGLEDRLDLANKNRDSLTKIISEKELTINQLNKNIAELKLEIAEQNRELAHLGLVVDQNDRFRADIDRLCNEADGLKAKLIRLGDVEHRLTIVQSERENLSSLLTNNLEHIRELNIRIADLEDQLSHLNELKTKVKLVVDENEHLNRLIIEKVRSIEEWSIKYDQLERLYVTVKETTEQLDHVKNKYQNAVRQSEVTNPGLRNSIYRGKADLYNSRYSANSEANTMGSPTDLLNSPPK